MFVLKDIAEEREILEEKAKKIHSANSSLLISYGLVVLLSLDSKTELEMCPGGKKAIVADKDLLESLRAAATWLFQWPHLLPFWQLWVCMFMM